VTVARQLGGRVLQMAIVVLVLVVGTSLLVRLVPGDPAQAILGLRATPQALHDLRTQLGLDKPVTTQVLDQLRDLARLDLGTSTRDGRPVKAVIGDAFPITLTLMLGGILIALAVSIPLGLLPALRRAPRLNRALDLTMVVLLAVPTFVVGIYALLLFAVDWHVAPAGGWGHGWPGNFKYAWLPACVLSLLLVPLLTRAVQRSTIDLLGEEFIEAARTRGLSERQIVFRHLLPNVLLPLITLVGYSASVLLGGAVIVEAVFGIPGFGNVIESSVTSRDYPVIVGTTLVSGVFVVTVNLITDLLYAVADPRTREG
jgi:peptide/nickel transport system permease protein